MRQTMRDECYFHSPDCRECKECLLVLWKSQVTGRLWNPEPGPIKQVPFAASLLQNHEASHYLAAKAQQQKCSKTNKGASLLRPVRLHPLQTEPYATSTSDSDAGHIAECPVSTSDLPLATSVPRLSAISLPVPTSSPRRDFTVILSKEEATG